MWLIEKIYYFEAQKNHIVGIYIKNNIGLPLH